jgi:hypothetical protein
VKRSHCSSGSSSSSSSSSIVSDSSGDSTGVDIVTAPLTSILKHTAIIAEATWDSLGETKFVPPQVLSPKKHVRIKEHLNSVCITYSPMQYDRRKAILSSGTRQLMALMQDADKYSIYQHMADTVDELTFAEPSEPPLEILGQIGQIAAFPAEEYYCLGHWDLTAAAGGGGSPRSPEAGGRGMDMEWAELFLSMGCCTSPMDTDDAV